MAKRSKQWGKLCASVADDDGLPVREAGSWTFDKLWWWHRYISITTTALVGRDRWPHRLCYLDLFAGPGVLEAKSTRERMPGSPLIAAEAPKPFDTILLCEKDEKLADACEERLRRRGHSNRCAVFRGNCNELSVEIAKAIPPQSLTLAFVDPTGLHANFSTLEVLAADRSVDFLILIADRMDIVRNVETYAGQAQSRLDDVLGAIQDWRGEWRRMPNQSAENTCRLFASLYRRQLAERLDYDHCDDVVLRLPSGAPIYRVLFASRHKLGLRFWEESTAKMRDGGKSLF